MPGENGFDCGDGIKIKLPIRPRRSWASRPIAYDTGFTLPPGVYHAQVLARKTNRKMGHYDSEVHVPESGGRAVRAETSSIVWSNQRQRQRRAGFAENKKKLIGIRSLVAMARSWCRASRTCSAKDQNLYVYMEIYDRPWMPIREASVGRHFRSTVARPKPSNPSRSGWMSLPRKGRRLCSPFSGAAGAIGRGPVYLPDQYHRRNRSEVFVPED